MNTLPGFTERETGLGIFIPITYPFLDAGYCLMARESWLAPAVQYGYNSHMKKATISEAKNRLSQLLDWVKAGETVVIMDRDVPVARLESMAGSRTPDSTGRLERLERQGMVQRGKKQFPAGFFERPLPKPKPGGDILKALLEEREDSP